MGIIKSILQTDLYKLTMMQVVMHHYPSAYVEYAFKCRNKVNLIPYADAIRKEIDEYCSLTLTESEAEYLGTIRFLKPDFIQFLKMFKLDPTCVTIDATGPELSIRIKGFWLHTILFEVPILSIVNEVYFRDSMTESDREKALDSGMERLNAKCDSLEAHFGPASAWYDNLCKNYRYTPFVFTDFGTRRRFSADWQETVVTKFKERVPKLLAGTSNVYLAKKLGLKPIGTMAHEFICASQAFVRLIDSQKYALETWAKEYRGDLGIALSDTLGIDAFLRDFDMFFAKLFDGVRHDSGDPYDWTKKVIAHYKSMNIDSRTKTAVYSDGLDIQKAIYLWGEFGGQIKTSFGIGTNLTADMEGVTPLQVVIKLVSCNGQAVAKISNSSGKGMCEDAAYLEYLKSVFKIGS